MSTVSQLAISQTVLKEQNKLFNFIRKRVNSTLDAEDILQDVFFQLARVSDEINNIEKLSAWLFQVARNKITDLYRKKKSVPFSQINSGVSDEEGTLEFDTFIPDLNDLPDEMLNRERVWEVLEEGLTEIPKEQREVFTMHEFDDMSFKEISEKTGDTINTLISRKRYAVLHLRKKLKEVYDEIIQD